jgi:hypothetical protein
MIHHFAGEEKADNSVGDEFFADSVSEGTHAIRLDPAALYAHHDLVHFNEIAKEFHPINAGIPRLSFPGTAALRLQCQEPVCFDFHVLDQLFSNLET